MKAIAIKLDKTILLGVVKHMRLVSGFARMNGQQIPSSAFLDINRLKLAIKVVTNLRQICFHCAIILQIHPKLSIKIESIIVMQRQLSKEKI
ncbi:MAG: hypothetical protein DCC43_01020 [Candidatus Brocadia sp.]|jgi:hypothetical protein|nr:hypothetical protein [Candidatus Brocadia sp.]MCE7910347.1 hypothetical protein [Candidatus Brocadia sp. AMX3]OQZ02198.1 MAG: hypothetical protein B6D35_01610 [Candidatus Brocadia sp. UTAMX2]MDG5997176.1 hypothetical protein [Candidatus Brocadia sp.]RIK03162.1 MAG: hypothetical protein DCC43_01020 [Candidatus Brocadia sp.]